MAALTSQKPNSIRTVKRDRRELAAGVTAIKGGLAACVAGYYRPATGAIGETVKGRFTETVANPGAAGAARAEVEFFRERTLILLVNDGTNPVVVAAREKSCSTLDDQTVRSSTAALSDAGVVYDVTSEGVWVEPDAPALPDDDVPNITRGNATLVSGTVTISAPLTASSRIFATMRDRGAGSMTGVVGFEVPNASRNVGAGTFVLRAIDGAGAVVATAVPTVDWMVVG